jgi:hypothetical protein
MTAYREKYTEKLIWRDCFSQSRYIANNPHFPAAPCSEMRFMPSILNLLTVKEEQPA